jgi:hypothetical protein
MRHRLVTQASTTAKAESSLKRIDWYYHARH